MTNLLLTIDSFWADAILDGRKNIELRKVMPKQEVSRLIIYRKGTGIIGSADILEIQKGRKDVMYRLTSKMATNTLLSQQEFDKYYADKDKAIAIRLANPQPLPQTITLEKCREILGKFNPPQSFLYVSDREWEDLKSSVLVGV